MRDQGKSGHPESADKRADKRLLRAELRRQRAALAPPAGSAAAREAARQVLGLLLGEPLFAAARCVGLYLPCGREFDPAPLGDWLRRAGALLCYPRVVGADPPHLAFHLVADPVAAPDKLETSPFGVLEPTADQPLAPAIDVFVVPGLGFDHGGHRLGYGRGFYDAALRAAPAALRIAPCYPFQLLGAIPHDEQDEPVDLIVTPLGVRRTFARPLLFPWPDQKENTE